MYICLFRFKLSNIKFETEINQTITELNNQLINKQSKIDHFLESANINEDKISALESKEWAYTDTIHDLQIQIHTLEQEISQLKINQSNNSNKIINTSKLLNTTPPLSPNTNLNLNISDELLCLKEQLDRCTDIISNLKEQNNDLENLIQIKNTELNEQLEIVQVSSKIFMCILFLHTLL